MIADIASARATFTQHHNYVKIYIVTGPWSFVRALNQWTVYHWGNTISTLFDLRLSGWQRWKNNVCMTSCVAMGTDWSCRLAKLSIVRWGRRGVWFNLRSHVNKRSNKAVQWRKRGSKYRLPILTMETDSACSNSHNEMKVLLHFHCINTFPVMLIYSHFFKNGTSNSDLTKRRLLMVVLSGLMALQFKFNSHFCTFPQQSGGQLHSQ